MGQCKTSDADVTIGCYYDGYSSCDNTIPTSLFINLEQFFFRSHLSQLIAQEVDLLEPKGHSLEFPS